MSEGGAIMFNFVMYLAITVAAMISGSMETIRKAEAAAPAGATSGPTRRKPFESPRYNAKRYSFHEVSQLSTATIINPGAAEGRSTFRIIVSLEHPSTLAC